MSIESIAKIGQMSLDPMLPVMPEMVTSTQTDNFSSLLMNKISSVDSHIRGADGLVESYIKGENIAVHDVLIAMGKAKTELQLVVEIRNKLLESYQEITKIQL
jgi:flagellar hook-basal body complex protein FliE